MTTIRVYKNLSYLIEGRSNVIRKVFGRKNSNEKNPRTTCVSTSTTI